MPSSLFWRTFLLLVALLAAAVLAWVQIFFWAEREPRSQQVARQIGVIVTLTRAALVSARPEARREVLREISDVERIEVHLAESADVLVPPPSSAGFARIRDLVSVQLGEKTRFAAVRNGVPGFWVSFFIEEDEFWLRLTRERVDYNMPQRLLIWGALAALAALLAAWFIAGRLSKPLNELAGAATAIGRGERPTPVNAGGAREVQQVVRAFNQMVDDLERQDRDRALVLAGISHDLRTPLARMRLEAEMSGDAAMRDGMVADIEQMDTIIGQFMDFARNSAAGEAAQEINLTALVASVQARYAARGTNVQVQTASKEIVIEGRAKALERALTNLIDNALRYGRLDNADAKIEVALSQTVEGSNQCTVIDVMDRGPGVPPDQIARVKQPFTRLEAARTDVTGSGLGLAIVERIARTHGGSLDLLPRNGGGLIARLTLTAVHSPLPNP